jgi:uncharacterized membrane protein
MKPLIVLLASALAAFFLILLLSGRTDYALAGRIGMSVMLLFTAIGHFLYTKGMALMMPPFMPFKRVIVYLTGILEMAAAAGLLFSRLQMLTGHLLILFFVLVLPANISAAMRHVDYQRDNQEGSGIRYLWFRIPLQLFFILWVFFFVIRNARLTAP